MTKIIHLVLLLSCITVLYSLPLTLNDDSDESSSSSSSSEESKEENNVQPPPSSEVQSSTTQLDNSTQNDPNIQKRDNTIVHTNAHQGAPDQINTASSAIPPNTLKESGYQPNQNRQTRDTSNENKPPSLSTSNPPRLDNQHKNLETPNNNNNNPNHQKRDTNNQEIPSKVVAANLSPVSSTREPQFGVKTNKFDNVQNRQVRDTRDQETPAKVIISNPNPANKQPQTSTDDASSQTANSDVKSKRQVRDSEDQETPAKALTSNPNSSGDSDKYSNINSGAANGQGADTNKRILSSLPSGVSSTESSNNDQNRQVRNIEPDETSSVADRSSDPSSTSASVKSSSTDSDSISSSSITSSTTSTTKHSIFTPEETSTGSNENDFKATDANEETPTVSSTQEPGDVYNDYLRKITSPSREIRDTSNIESIPSVYKSYPSEGSSTELPGISNVQGGNTPNTHNSDTDHLNPSLTSYNQGSAKIPGDTNSEYHISGSDQHKRDTSDEDTSKVLTPSRSADVSTLKADEIPVNVQNEDSKQRKLRETSTKNSKPTEQSDDVKVVKLNDTPPYPKRQQ